MLRALLVAVPLALSFVAPASALTDAQCQALRWQLQADLEFQRDGVALAQKLIADKIRLTLLTQFTADKAALADAPPNIASALADIDAHLDEVIAHLSGGAKIPQSAQTAAVYALVEVCPP